MSRNDASLREKLAEHTGAIGWALLGLAFLALFVASRMIEVDEYVSTLREWVWGFGVWAPVAYVGLFVAATLVAFPGTPFTILAAFLFGSAKGFAVMVVATTLSASAGFLLSRYLLKETFEEKLRGTDSYERLQSLMQEGHWMVIPFVRLMPVFPFTFNNFALGLTKISFTRYLLWSELVMIPMNAVLVLGASAVYRAMVRGEVSWWLVGISVGSACAVLLIGLAGRRLLDDGTE